MLWIFLLLATIMPPLKGYYDPYITPKWIWSMVFVLFLIITWMWRECLSPNIKHILLNKSPHMPLVMVMCICGLVFFSKFNKSEVDDYMMFENSTVISLHLCILLPFIFEKKVYPFSYIIWPFILTALLLLQCRTAYICIFVYITSVHSHCKWNILFPIVFAISIAVFTKSDSTRGRWFIINNTFELIKQEPVIGYGYNGFGKNYMLQQENYFRNHPNSEFAILSDNIHHPLNEFLFVTVNGGLVGLILLLIILCGPFLYNTNGVRNSPLLLSLITICIFSLFSYPLRYPLTWVIIAFNWIKYPKNIFTRFSSRVIFSIVCIITSIFIMRENYYLRKWGRISYIAHNGHPYAMMNKYKSLYTHFCHNSYFIYDYAIESYCAKQLKVSNHLLQDLEDIQTDYETTLLHGDVFLHQGAYKSALYYYEKASYMCPVRFAPLEGMLQVYENTNQAEKGKLIARIILNKQIKVYSYDVALIKKEAAKFMNKTPPAN